MTTLDTDVALPAELPVGEQDIRARLLAQGFTEEFLGDDHPPATHYHLGGEASRFYAEFLTPLVGSEYDRKHKRKATMEIAGIASQQLRYIELLLHHPWWINLEYEGSASRIQIANPVSYLAQKVLIHAKREREDRAKTSCTCTTLLKCSAHDSLICTIYGRALRLGNFNLAALTGYRVHRNFYLVN